jgi:hypothetical protein
MEAYTLKAFSGDVSDLESARTEFQLFTYSFQHFLLRFLYIYLFFCLVGGNISPLFVYYSYQFNLGPHENK